MFFSFVSLTTYYTVKSKNFVGTFDREMTDPAANHLPDRNKIIVANAPPIRSPFRGGNFPFLSRWQGTAFSKDRSCAPFLDADPFQEYFSLIKSVFTMGIFFSPSFNFFYYIFLINFPIYMIYFFLCFSYRYFYLFSFILKIFWIMLY